MPRYTKLGYIALNVSDLARSKYFYETLWGLELTEVGNESELYFRCTGDHHNIVLYKGAKPGLKRLAWEMESEADLDELASALTRSGAQIREVDRKECVVLHQGRSIRFSDPFTGATHEYYADMHRLGGKPWVPTHTKIQRVGHVVLRTPRYEEALDFYQQVLNFRVSDKLGNLTTFMRCFPNPYHHSLGLSNGSSGKSGTLQHLNFMVTEVDDIGKAIWRFKKNDVPVVWGPGRHPASGSMFLYALDPDGITVEYSFGMEEFAEEQPRKLRLLSPVPESADFWGAPRDPRMGTVGTIEV